MKITLKACAADIEIIVEGDVVESKDRKSLVNQMFYTIENVLERTKRGQGATKGDEDKELSVPEDYEAQEVDPGYFHDSADLITEQDADSIVDAFNTDYKEEAKPSVNYNKVTDSQIAYLRSLGATEEQITALKNKKEATALINKLKGE